MKERTMSPLNVKGRFKALLKAVMLTWVPRRAWFSRRLRKPKA
jgi:hypothetical protein